MNPILKGYRVLDFGRYIAAPYCAALLGQLGADVIRIERPNGSEDRYIAPITEQGDGALFMQMNAGKRGMTLNIAKPAGREIVKQLVATADVVVANLPPNVLKKLNLDYEALQAIKPDIILTANSAFGSTGPYANRPGFDGIGQVMSGATWFSGHLGQPAKAAVHYVDYSSALSATIGTLAALMARQQTGKGQIVETSLLNTALTLMNGSLIEQAVTQINRQPSGNRGQTAAPADIFATQDGHIIVQVVGPYIFKRLATLMNEEAWLTDTRFKDDTARGHHREILCARVAAWCAERHSETALSELEANRIPCGPVLSLQDALDHPVIQATDAFEAISYPGAARPIPIVKSPFRLSQTPILSASRAPTVGEHTRQILQELGYNPAQINELQNNQII